MCWIQLREEEVSAAEEGRQDGQEEGIHGRQMCLDISDIIDWFWQNYLSNSNKYTNWHKVSVFSMVSRCELSI